MGGRPDPGPPRGGGIWGLQELLLGTPRCPQEPGRERGILPELRYVSPPAGAGGVDGASGVGVPSRQRSAEPVSSRPASQQDPGEDPGVSLPPGPANCGGGGGAVRGRGPRGPYRLSVQVHARPRWEPEEQCPPVSARGLGSMCPRRLRPALCGDPPAHPGGGQGRWELLPQPPPCRAPRPLARRPGPPRARQRLQLHARPMSPWRHRVPWAVWGRRCRTRVSDGETETRARTPVPLPPCQSGCLWAAARALLAAWHR